MNDRSAFPGAIHIRFMATPSLRRAPFNCNPSPAYHLDFKGLVG